MALEFTGEVVQWRGPAPYHFLVVPPELCDELRELASEVTYGWGMVPVRATLGGSSWETSLWPREGGYVLPVKDKVRSREDVSLGDVVDVAMDVVTRNGRLVYVKDGERGDFVDDVDG